MNNKDVTTLAVFFIIGVVTTTVAALIGVQMLLDWAIGEQARLWVNTMVGSALICWLVLRAVQGGRPMIMNIALAVWGVVAFIALLVFVITEDRR